MNTRIAILVGISIIGILLAPLAEAAPTLRVDGSCSNDNVRGGKNCTVGAYENDAGQQCVGTAYHKKADGTVDDTGNEIVCV